MLHSSYRLLKLKTKLVSFTLLFLFAVYVLVGRFLLNALPDYQEDIESFLSEKIQMPVEIASLNGRWIGFDPVIDVNGLSVRGAENIYIGRARVRLSFLGSLMAMSPRFKSIIVEHSEFTLHQEDKDNAWTLAGLEIPEENDEVETDFSGLAAIFNGVAMTLKDNTIVLRHIEGKVQMLRLPAVHLRYLNDSVIASGKVLQEEGQKTLLNFSFEGHGVLSTQDIASTLFLEARSAEFFDRFLKTYHWSGVSIQDIDASARVWITFDGLNVTSVQGETQVSELNWKVNEKSLPPLLNAALSFQVKSSGATQSILLTGMSLNWAGNTCDSPEVALTNSDVEFELRASQLNIQCVSLLASEMEVFPETLQDRLDVSLPEGSLRNIKITIREPNTKNILVETLEDYSGALNSQEVLSITLPEERFSFEAELDGVSLNAYSGTPSVKGLDGYIYADTKGGGVFFDSQRFELGFPDLFVNTWQMKKTEGAVSWLLHDEDVFVYSEGLRLYQQDDSLVYGDFFLRLNPIEKEDYLSLTLGMQDILFTNASDFVPGLIVGEDLNKWLDDSLVSGRVSEGVYIGYGSIESDSPENSFTSSIYLKSSQGELSFAEGWPNLKDLNADIHLQNSELSLTADRGRINETELLAIRANMPVTESGEIENVYINAQVEAGKAEQDYWLKASPISSETKAIVEQLEIVGDVGVSLGLTIPLAEGVDVKYDVESTLNAVSVKHLATDLLFDNIQGLLKVSSESGVTASGLSSEFLGQSADINIATSTRTKEEDKHALQGTNTGNSAANSQSEHTIIALDSEIPIVSLLNHFKQKEIVGLSGKLNYHAELDLPSQGEAEPNLTITSDLKGVVYDCPAPFTKKALEARDLMLSLLIGQEAMNLNVRLNSADSPSITSDLLFIENELSSGEVLIGSALSQQTKPHGINILANISSLSLDPWVEFIKKSIGTGEGSNKDLIQSVDISVGKLEAYGQSFNNTQALMTKPLGPWELGLRGESIQGKVKFPLDNKPIDIALDHIFLVTDLESQFVKAEDERLYEVNEVALFDPRTLPEITFSTKKLVKDKANYGAWKAHVLPNEHGTIFKDVKGTIKGTGFEGQLNWKVDDSLLGQTVHTSILTMDVGGKEFESLTKAIGKDELVSSEKFNANFSLVWPGGPQEFRLANVSGSALLNMEDGFLNTEDAKTGALRIFGILNAESIMRRLKLDFSDLYKSGVGYDVLSVKTTINRGLLSFTEPLVIEGPSSEYVINGHVDLKKETLDMDMLVQLPVVQNIPMAALILGAPQIGGAVWLVDKLLGEPLSAITTARYDITGSWDKPDVKLNKAMNASKKDRSKQNSLR